MSGRRSKALRAKAYGAGLPAPSAARLYRVLKRVWTASRSRANVEAALVVAELVQAEVRRSV